MVLTEEEAREKWCPFARVAHGPTPITGAALAAVNRFPKWLSQVMGLRDHAEERLKTCNCIASQCMAWRWKDPGNPYPEDRVQWGGYCGLAGKPE